MKIKFELNGHPIEVDENPRKKLSEFLRQNNYFSVKNGCGHGSCNSCTILVNDEPMLSCIIPLAKIINSKITTLEHFMKTDDYEDIEKAFKELDIDVVMSVGKNTDIKSLGEIPNSFCIKNSVNQIEVLQNSDVFITHCGMNSVNESLYYGVPMVLFPQHSEQKMVCDRVYDLEAGIILKNTR